MWDRDAVSNQRTKWKISMWMRLCGNVYVRYSSSCSSSWERLFREFTFHQESAQTIIETQEQKNTNITFWLRHICSLPMYQVHRFSDGCRRLMIMCATRSSRCTLVSTIVRRMSGGRDLPQAQVGRLRKPSGNAAQQPSSLTLSNGKMCRSSCPRGAEWLDRSWRLSAWGHRTTRAWKQYGAKSSAALFIKLGGGFGQRI